MFSKMLPSVQGVSQEVHGADSADLRKVHALTKNHFTSPAETGFGGPASFRFGHLAVRAQEEASITSVPSGEERTSGPPAPT